MFHNARLARQRRAELTKAREELDDMRTELMEAYAHFDRIADTELLDACIFHISALSARYDATLRQVKRKFE